MDYIGGRSGTIGANSITVRQKVQLVSILQLLEKGTKFKKSNVTKPLKNTPSQDGTEWEQGGRRFDLFTKRMIELKMG